MKHLCSKQFLKERSGMVLMPVLIMVVVLGMASAMFLMVSISSGNASNSAIDRRRVLYVAEAGISEALTQLAPTLTEGVPGALGSEADPINAPGGSYWATGLLDADQRLSLVATGMRMGQRVTVAADFQSPLSIKDFAVYAGNASGDPNVLFELGGTGGSADQITGDVYVAGDIALTADSSLTGNALATGVITGNPVTGTESEYTSTVAKPDLAAMNYAAVADFVLDASTPFDIDGELPETDPRHIFVEDFRDDLATSAGFVFDNENYFFGDPHENNNLTHVSVSADGNNKIYYIDGNLWIEPQGTESSLVDSPAGGTVITIVVRGNIYFSDTLKYDTPEDGLLFVALTDGESYTDLDGDNQYDVGEPILHDDGDGIYEGNEEGSGNIHFGDPNGGPLGDLECFLYAENHFEDHVLDGTGGDPLPFSVTGFLSAGEQVRINRDYAGDHARMVVEYDSRIQDGTLELPGLPGSSGNLGDWVLSCWRVTASN